MGYGTQAVQVWDCVPGCPVAELDRQSGECPGMTGGGIHSIGYGRGMFGAIDSTRTARGDTGGASRFFFCAKASRSEREFGCELLPARKASETLGREEGSAGLTPRAGAGRTADTVKNFGPCVKPLRLTRWLATLPLPPKRATPRRIVVPYAGTGSEMVGALRAGWDEVVGIQRVADDDERAYVAIAKARIARWLDVPESLDESEVCAEAEQAVVEQTSLFGAR
jgi:site-specific DNA-methyltransferase (adenine-specific)